jgi:hypothetical protein
MALRARINSPSHDSNTCLIFPDFKRSAVRILMGLIFNAPQMLQQFCCRPMARHSTSVIA